MKMKTFSELFHKTWFLLITVSVYVVLIGLVLMLMRHIEQLLILDAKTGMTEVAALNSEMVSNRITQEMLQLELLSNRIAVSLDDAQADPKSLHSLLTRLTERMSGSFFVADRNGKAFLDSGQKADIAGRNYFKKALAGISNTAGLIPSRFDGSTVFVFSVPIHKSSLIVGTLQKSFSPQELYALCVPSLFASQGLIHLIDAYGHVLIATEHNGRDHASANYFHALLEQGNHKAARQLKDDIRAGRSGFLETTEAGQPLFSAYCPIPGWDHYLITSIATDVVAEHTNEVLQLLYALLLSLSAIFGLTLFYFLTLKRRERLKLELLAYEDSVTGGCTFTKFLVKLPESLKKAVPGIWGILYFDIDNFKYINNLYGHTEGDAILLEVDKTVRSRLRPEELLARISGDHFIALLEDITPERLSGILAPLVSRNITVTFSGGVYPVHDCNEDSRRMVDKAGIAVRESKGNPHNRISFYSDDLDRKLIHDEQLKQRIEEGLQQGEMLPFYQPKIDVRTGRLVGAEALARWRTSDGKLISPAEFIPLCEKTGLIARLDMAIFEQVLTFLRDALDRGVNCVPVSVNFSRHHLLDKNFPKKLADRLVHRQVPPELIELELTENLFCDNHGMMIDFITHMHEKKLRVVMDDFGTGYSSLGMLQSIPIDGLKIDQSFLKKSLTETDVTRRDIIFSAIAQMAMNLNLEVVVEGVETEENVAMMTRFNCSVAQGYYFSRPLDPITFEKIFREGHL